MRRSSLLSNMFLLTVTASSGFWINQRPWTVVSLWIIGTFQPEAWPIILASTELRQPWLKLCQSSLTTLIDAISFLAINVNCQTVRGSALAIAGIKMFLFWLLLRQPWGNVKVQVPFLRTPYRSQASIHMALHKRVACAWPMQMLMDALLKIGLCNLNASVEKLVCADGLALKLASFHPLQSSKWNGAVFSMASL